LLLLSSRFSDWLASVDACLSLTTYQAGRLLAAAAGRDLPDLLVNPIARETDGNPSLILEALLLLAQEGIDGLTG